MRWWLSGLVAFLITSGAQAQLTGLTNTKAFWVLCGPDSPVAAQTKSSCALYLAGAIDLQRMYDESPYGGLKMCFPPDFASTMLLDIFLRYLGEHPERREGLTVATLFIAMTTYFPCPKPDAK